jgi:hypothetical protein
MIRSALRVCQTECLAFATPPMISPFQRAGSISAGYSEMDRSTRSSAVRYTILLPIWTSSLLANDGETHLNRRVGRNVLSQPAMRTWFGRRHRRHLQCSSGEWVSRAAGCTRRGKTIMSIIVKRRPAAFTATPAFVPPTSVALLSPANPLGSSLSTTRHSRHRQLDDAAHALASIIVEIRKAGHEGIAEIAMCLNAKGLVAPSGGPFTYETTRRILKRIKLLGLGDGPQTKSAAMLIRADKDRERRLRKFAEDLARRTREHAKSGQVDHVPES